MHSGPNRYHRASRAPNDLLCPRSEQNHFELLATMCSHHKQVDMSLLDDGRKDIPDFTLPDDCFLIHSAEKPFYAIRLFGLLLFAGLIRGRP
jgi:hypothetical protein